MWRYVLDLIKEEVQQDAIGNEIMVETRNEVFCDIKSVSRNEFYQASTVGLKPAMVFVVKQCDYADEEVVDFEGTKYNVLRTYLVDSENIELTCEKVLGNGK